MPWQFIHIDLFSPSALSRGKAELEQERWWGRGSKARRSERSGKESYATTIIAMTSSSLYPVPWGSEFTMSCLSFKSLPSLLLKYGCARWIIYTVIDCKLQKCSNDIATWYTRWNNASNSGAECSVHYIVELRNVAHLQLTVLALHLHPDITPRGGGHLIIISFPPTFHSLHLSLVLRN